MGFTFKSHKLVPIEDTTQYLKEAILKRESEGYQLGCIECFELKGSEYDGEIHYTARMVDFKRDLYRLLETRSYWNKVTDEHAYVNDWKSLTDLHDWCDWALEEDGTHSRKSDNKYAS